MNEGLGMEPEDVRRMCRSSPALLTVTYELVQAKVRLGYGTAYNDASVVAGGA